LETEPRSQMKYSRFLLHQYLNKSLVIFLGFAIMTCLHAPTNAYVLPGPYILELMTQNLGKAKSILVSQKLVIHDDTPQKSAVELSETLRYVFPEMFRSDTLSENVHRIHVLSKGRAVTVLDGKVADESDNRYDRYKDILLFKPGKMLQDKLSLLGVDITVSSLGRFQGKPAYVLGAQYPDETTDQVWLDKDTFRPFRWIMTSKPEQSRENSVEIRYDQWQKVQNTWYPMRIEFFMAGILVREIDVQNIKVNPSFSKKLFDIKHLKSLYPQGPPAIQEQENKTDLDEVQKTIEDFKKLYE
jgi:outer membrane lipoprotein-sorting protein